MSALLAATAVFVLVVALAAVHVPLGDYMAHVFSSPTHWRAERAFYRFSGIDPDQEQTWRSYVRSVLAFSVVGVTLLYGLQRLQSVLPWSEGHPGVDPLLAFNTAASFVTNTNWQSYSPEQTMGDTVQALGLAVQNFVSAAVGLSVAVALIRAFVARRSGTIGNFWVDLVRSTLRILLPLSFLAALVLVTGGVIQNFNDVTTAQTLAGGTQSIPGGPVASQEAIKLLGTNGGGFFNANSAHPFENPTAWTNLFEIFLILVIPFSLPRTFGRLVGDLRQGRAVLAAMAVLCLASIAALTWAEVAGRGSAPQLAGAAMEGKEQRFGVVGSALFSAVTTLTSTGAVDGAHDSLTSLGGGVAMINMMLGEVAPGGVGSGLYGMLMAAIIAVFLGGLMVGRTPEYLGKKIGPREMKLASLYVLTTPLLVLAGTAISLAIPAAKASITSVSILNPGTHGFSEVLYAMTSAANNNGSAFAGLSADTPWLNVVLAVLMLAGRFIPIILVLALAGSLAAQSRVPATSGTLPTHGPLFVLLLIGVIVIIAALTFFPMLALGPLAEGL